MTFQTAARLGLILIVVSVLASCGRGPGSGIGSSGGIREASEVPPEFDPRVNEDGSRRSTIWDLFANNEDPNVTVEVNRYIWNAALDVLNFMPIQSVDPFSGVIVMGYGRPPGGRQAYRATVYVKDPALDARSLTVALQSRGGPVSVDTVRAVEDAILTRARQLRIADGNL